MEADIKQQKVHNQETIQALLLVYNNKKSGRDGLKFSLHVPQFRIIFFSLNSGLNFEGVFSSIILK